TENAPLLTVRARLDERVRYVEWDDPHYAVLSLVPNDARYNDAGHYGSKKIGGEAAWDVTTGSTAVKVGMLDSGLYKAHEEWAGQTRVLQGYDFQNNDNDPNDESGCSWHGSHTTGTAGATINNAKGIAGMSQHTILPVKAFYTTFLGCSAGTTPLVNAIKYIGDQGSHVSSNSWGSSASSTVLNDAVQYSHDRGVIHVAAAGNSGPCTNCVSYPWKDKSSVTIVVAATDSADAKASFSSQGPEVDVAAPGVSILSLCGSSTTCYQSISGTSMATPHVAGTAALLKARNGGATFTNVNSCLTTTALDLGAAGKDDQFGYGRIRADQALSCIGGAPPPAQCADALDNDGDGLVDYPNDPGCTSSTDNDETNPPPGEAQVYFENLDDGQAQGWTKSSSSDLWHVEDGCVADHTAPNKLAWTRASFCNYSTGARVTNWARSGAIGLSGKTQGTLKLVHQFNIEQYSAAAYDILRVQVSRDAVSWTTLQQWDSRNSDVTAWTALSYDIDGFTGGSLYVRFWTDTVDSLNNANPGWYIDNIEVTAS
ncbi:MAG: S8 family serine peptidase, partial [Methanobacteriota archaeon]